MQRTYRLCKRKATVMIPFLLLSYRNKLLARDRKKK